jgi:hypothetical protein
MTGKITTVLAAALVLASTGSAIALIDRAVLTPPAPTKPTGMGML